MLRNRGAAAGRGRRWRTLPRAHSPPGRAV